MTPVRPFIELQDVCRALEWDVTVELLTRAVAGTNSHTTHAIIIVQTPDGEDNYSHTVMAHESYDRCADIILRGLRKSKVLPKRRRR